MTEKITVLNEVKVIESEVSIKENKLLYNILILYYSLKSPFVPKRTKLLVAGGLCYLILPIDLIPDFIPVVGLTDDFALIIISLVKLLKSVDDTIRDQAHEKMLSLLNNKIF